MKSYIIVFLIVLVLILATEVVFRYIIPAPFAPLDMSFYKELLIEDEELGYLHRPNSKKEYITINSLGFRGPEPVEGRDNIICVGDSHVFGFGVGNEETWPYKLQKALNDEYNVINMSLLAYEHCREIVLLNRYLEELKPKIVIFGVTILDIRVDMPRPPYVKKATAKRPYDIIYDSAFATYFRNLFPGLRIKLGLSKGLHEQYYAHWNDEELFGVYRENMEKEIAKLLESNIKVVFVVFPHYAEVFLMQKQTRPTIEYFRSLKDVEVIDLKPIFQEHYKTLSTLFLSDGHPNKYAYELVAEEVLCRIQDLL